MLPSQEDWFDAVDATWPPFARFPSGIWTLRQGQGAGKRVSAASTVEIASTSDIGAAEKAMHSLGQTPLFMVREGQRQLDSLLDQKGYKVVDPVTVLAARCADLADYRQQSLRVIFSQEPIAILREIWRQGGVDDPRIEVMRRAAPPKTFVLGRYENQPVAAQFLGCHKTIGMVHAVEVLQNARRNGVGQKMMQGAAWWAQQQGMEWISCLTVCENSPAQALYRNLGMEVVSRYHYRKPATPT